MNKKTVISLIISVLCFVVVFAVALIVGKYSMSISDFFKAVFTNDSAFDTQRSIIVNLRLPRTIIAGLSGIALAISGLLYQEVFQNKLTSPDLLGVSSGASVGASIAIILGLSSAFISIFAFIAGVVTVLITIFISKVFKNGSFTLVLAGIIVGGFMSALLSLVKYFSDPTTTLATISYWLMGSFENATMNQVYILLPLVGIPVLIVLAISFRLNVVGLGPDEAKTKGVPYNFYKYLCIGFATLLTASTVAFSGVISWVGLVIPHLVRLIVGRDTRRTIPLCITFGGVFMIVVDILSRSFTNSEMPLSAVTGILGTVIFVVILIAKRREYNVN